MQTCVKKTANNRQRSFIDIASEFESALAFAHSQCRAKTLHELLEIHMNQSTQTAFVAMAIALYAQAAAAGTMQLQTPITYDPGANVVQTVKEECKIEDLLAKRVTRLLARRNASSKGDAEAHGDAGRPEVLKLTITNVFGVGGGMYSGPKAVNLKVELLEGDRLKREQNFKRGSMGGMWGPLKGTCSIFNRVTKRLTQDIGRWLNDPAYKPAADEPEKPDDGKEAGAADEI